jgi:hypothetical protein
MTIMPGHRVQCDTCLTVVILQAKDSRQWGAELQAKGWIARQSVRGKYDYRHACELCANLKKERQQ